MRPGSGVMLPSELRAFPSSCLSPLLREQPEASFFKPKTVKHW